MFLSRRHQALKSEAAESEIVNHKRSHYNSGMNSGQPQFAKPLVGQEKFRTDQNAMEFARAFDSETCGRNPIENGGRNCVGRVRFNPPPSYGDGGIRFAIPYFRLSGGKCLAPPAGGQNSAAYSAIPVTAGLHPM
jgi:hypothetical protein